MGGGDLIRNDRYRTSFNKSGCQIKEQNNP